MVEEYLSIDLASEYDSWKNPTGRSSCNPKIRAISAEADMRRDATPSSFGKDKY
jgi:hypothetical protein